MSYEKEGVLPDVVFLCGNAVIGQRLFVYYSSGDRVIGIDSMELSDLFDQFTT
jgi:beta-1,2-mannobiose phosphorylase / 1,2-beta-oligomannan phosphorylase